MWNDFKIKSMFKGQYHQCYQFSLKVDGDFYQGIFRYEKIHWLYPNPQHKLEEEVFQYVESEAIGLIRMNIEYLSS